MQGQWQFQGNELLLRSPQKGTVWFALKLDPEAKPKAFQLTAMEPANSGSGWMLFARENNTLRIAFNDNLQGRAVLEGRALTRNGLVSLDGNTVTIGNTVTAPVMLLSSTVVTGPYTEAVGQSVNLVTKTITVPVSGSMQFYRIRSGSALTFTGITVSGGNVVLTYN